jgi:hypothetical protein
MCLDQGLHIPLVIAESHLLHLLELISEALFRRYLNGCRGGRPR